MGRQKYWEEFESEANRIKSLPHIIKWWWQRRTRGFDDREIWDLNEAIIRFVLPRLEAFYEWQQEHGMSVGEGTDPARWLKIMRKMISTLKTLNEGGEIESREGLELLGKYLLDLRD